MSPSEAHLLGPAGQDQGGRVRVNLNYFRVADHQEIERLSHASLIAGHSVALCRSRLLLPMHLSQRVGQRLLSRPVQSFPPCRLGGSGVVETVIDKKEFARRE